MLRVYPAKINYIVDREKVDAVVMLGFTMNDLKRLRVRGMPPLDFKVYKKVKRILSDSLHRKKVLVRVYPFSEIKIHEVWDADFYEQPEDLDAFDPLEDGLDGLKCISAEILEKVKKVLDDNKRTD